MALRIITAEDRNAVEDVAKIIERIYSGMLATNDFSLRSTLLRDAFEKARYRVNDIAKDHTLDDLDGIGKPEVAE